MHNELLLEDTSESKLGKYPLLDKVSYPSDLKHFNLNELKLLADELRRKTVEVVSKTGGHLGAGLGVVELTLALHYIFNTPEDLLIFDVGHQAYPHKILTGRKNEIETLRQGNGLSGFTRRAESIYDPFGAGHSSTSISAALGMAVADQIQGKDRHVLAVIGDGALSAGMAYEAMNNANIMKTRLTVILNDNDMSIAPPVGGMSNYLSRLISSPQYLGLRNFAKNIAEKFPDRIEQAVKNAERYAKTLATGGNFFEEMGFYYIGPVDGHNLDHLVPVLKNISEDTTIDRPVLIHVVTEKGKGFKAEQQCSEKYHAIGKFDFDTGVLKTSAKPSLPKYTDIFASQLIKEATKDDKIVAITAAMPSGTGLDKFAQAFPNRMFDVGIAEQHAVTFAAGLAVNGMKPFVAIYSTFLQRAYDQIIHDVALQNLPVRFAIDRAGYVGADGPTHAGSFDITYLTCLPNMVVIAPSTKNELEQAVSFAANFNDGPIAFRYPRGESIELCIPDASSFELGKGRLIRQGQDVAILALGTYLTEAVKAADLLAQQGINVTIADARFAKPIDEELLSNLAKTHKLLITIEDGAIGGFGSHALKYLADNDLMTNLKVKTLCYPDVYVEQDTQENQAKMAGLDSESIANLISKIY